jgi:hypothetical protein
MLGGEAAFFAIGAGSETRVLSSFTVDGAGDRTDWRIAADGVELSVSGEGDAAPASPGAGFDQLCSVHGGLALHGAEHDLDCAGLRGSRDEPQLGQAGSLREVSAWFERDEGVSLLAVRPRKAPGHGGDTITAAVFDGTDRVIVAEPRLSTTYAAVDLPSRMGLELWIGEDDAEQYPRRFTGEAIGPRAAASVGPYELSATLLRCHSRGRDGTGVYLLASRA